MILDLYKMKHDRLIINRFFEIFSSLNKSSVKQYPCSEFFSSFITPDSLLIHVVLEIIIELVRVCILF